MKRPRVPGMLSPSHLREYLVALEATQRMRNRAQALGMNETEREALVDLAVRLSLETPLPYNRACDKIGETVQAIVGLGGTPELEELERLIRHAANTGQAR